MNRDSFARAARNGLIILTLINLFNYLDRYIVSALVESLKKSELQLSDAEAGFLMTGFVIVYMVASPVFGILGDRMGRSRLIAGGVAVWSLATALGGLAGRFSSLLAARACIGIGEAAYGTIAPAMIADYYPPERRGRAYAIFFSAIPIGSALGYVLGGLVDQHYGWRAAFFVAGIPGILLALAALRVFDPPRGAQEHQPVAEGPKVHEPALKSYAKLLRDPAYLRSILGYAAYTFGLGGLAFWMPAYLERVRGLPKAEASVQFGAIVVVTGFIGTFVGGWLGDALLKRTKQAYLWVCGVSTLLALPFLFMALRCEDPTLYWTGMVFAELMLFASTGPINSVVVGLVEPAKRATAVAACNFMIHVFGDVPSPPLIGWISDQSSLQSAILLVPISIAVSGLIWTASAVKGDAPA